MDDFLSWNSARWISAIGEAFPDGPPMHKEWTDLNEIVSVLSHFTKENLNHTMYPGGGGNDFERVALAQEPNCIELYESPPNACEICRPDRLIFEYFEADPLQSFFLLECGKLEPTGIYENISRGSEELILLPDGEYMDRASWDSRVYSLDDNGNEMGFPKGTKIICRFLDGKFLMVAKTSAWNNTGSTYDGRHNKMSAAQIRWIIERVIERSEK